MSFAIEIAFFENLFFLPFFSSFCQSNSDFYKISSCMDLEWDESSSHFFCFLWETQYFFHTHQYESLSFWVELSESCSELVFWDMESDENGSPTMERDIGSLEISLPKPETLDFTSFENNPTFIFLYDLIIKKGFSIFHQYVSCMIFFLWHDGIIWKCIFFQIYPSLFVIKIYNLILSI